MHELHNKSGSRPCSGKAAKDCWYRGCFRALPFRLTSSGIPHLTPPGTVMQRDDLKLLS